MSYDEYVHHIAQKYRLAVAISVIKTKPDNVSIEEYLLQLQNKIKNTEIDPNDTVCSDDFNFDATPHENKSNTQAGRTKCDIANGNGIDYFENENDSHGSQTILNDFVFANELESNNNIMQRREFDETITLLKEVTTDIPEKHNNQNLSQTTFCESQESINHTDNDITYCTTIITPSQNLIEINSRQIQNDKDNTDSQETQLYTLHGFTQNDTHVSQTQGDYFIIADKYIRNKINNGNNVRDNLEEIDKIPGDNTEVIYNVNQNVLTREFAIANEVVEKPIYEVNFSKTQFQSKEEFASIKDVNAEGADNIEKVTHNAVKYVENTGLAQTFQFNIHNIDELTSINEEAIFTRDRCKDKQNNVYDASINNNSEFNNNPLYQSLGSENTPKVAANVINKIEYIGGKNNIQYSQGILEPSTMNNNNITNVQQSTEVESIEMEDMEVDASDSDEHFEERLPFKVLEELNRVKCFLNRRDRRNDGGYSTDSGYRSDSKSRSLVSSSQLSGTSGWLNQSAHCLFNHILQTSGTDDINKEIAQVLGLLIDKLHEEENYPPFLEELLETVDQMLKETQEGGGWAENVLITKDENIQRLLLLNKSKHILQYTIEKISVILQELHTKLTQENLYELSNVVEVENVCYIFHILEIFLKRYMKVKDVSSQSTQNSQEDTFPKRSSLTELWRKKWNPNSKDVIKNENKTCVLKRCSEILNKIIVECMDGYSLVAFAALQCFNLIQV